MTDAEEVEMPEKDETVTREEFEKFKSAVKNDVAVLAAVLHDTIAADGSAARALLILDAALTEIARRVAPDLLREPPDEAPIVAATEAAN